MRSSSSYATGGRLALLGSVLLSLLLAACGSGGGGGGTGYSLEVTPASLEFSAERNATMPPAQDLVVRFNGDGLLAGWPAGSSEPSWLSLGTKSGAGSPATLSVRVNTTSLGAGEYDAIIRLATGKADGSAGITRDVPVRYVLRAGLQAPTTPIAFTSPEGVAPPPQTLMLSSDVLPKAWSVVVEPVGTAPADWLSVPVAGGTLETGPAQVELRAAARPAGSYAANVVVKDGAGTERARISVSYRVNPAFAVSGAIATVVTEGATWSSLDLPLAIQTKVDAATGAAYRWQVTSSVPWLTVTPASGDLSADSQLVARLDPDRLWALANATYPATITVQLTEVGASSATVPVSVQVKLAPALATAPGVAYSVDRLAAAGDLSRSVTVTSNLGAVFAGRGAWQASTAAAWLAANPSGGSGLALDVVPAALAALPNGAHAATVTIQPDDARVAPATLQADLTLALPDVDHVAPYNTWIGLSADVIVRGSGFGAAGPVPVTFGAAELTGQALSDTELRFTAPPQDTAGPIRVSIANSLGLARAASDLVVLPEPGYAAHTKTLTGIFRRMTLDPERKAVLLSGPSAGEIHRFRFDAGAWSEDVFTVPNASGAYVTVDGKDLFVTAGSTGTDELFLLLDPVTLAIRQTTGYHDSYSRFDIVAGFNDGRVLIMDSDQWVESLWYPSLTRGLYVDAHSPLVLFTRDRSRLIVCGTTVSRLSSYDVTDAAAKARSIPANPWGARDWGVSGDGGRLVVDTAVYDRDFGYVGSLVLPEVGVDGVAVSPDGNYVYTLGHPSSTDMSWVLRRTDIRAASGPYPGDATALPFSLVTGEIPIQMVISEDGSTLFLLTSGPGTTPTTFHALPLPAP